MKHIFGLRISRNPKNANLATMGKHGASQGQWWRMTSLSTSKYNVKGDMWSSPGLNHTLLLHSSQWQRVKLLKDDFAEKFSRRSYLLWIQAPLPNLNRSISFAKTCKSMTHKLRKMSARYAERFSVHFRKKSWGLGSNQRLPPPPPPLSRQQVPFNSVTNLLWQITLTQKETFPVGTSVFVLITKTNTHCLWSCSARVKPGQVPKLSTSCYNTMYGIVLFPWSHSMKCSAY